MTDELLKRYINDTTPFGPIKSEDMTSRNGLTAFRALYTSGTEVHNRLEKQQPNALIGRKGSGKTAFLLGRLVERDSLVVRLKQSALFNNMSNIVRAFNEKGAAYNVDTLAGVWDIVIVHVVAIRLADTLEDDDPDRHKGTLWRYLLDLEGAGFINQDAGKDVRSNEVAAWISNELQRLVAEASEKPTLEYLTASLRYGDLDYMTLRQSCREVSLSREYATTVLIDTVEDFGENFTKLADVTRGLMQLLAQHRFDRTEDDWDGLEGLMRSPYDLFVCLPSEVSELMSAIASNPAKSMERSLRIEWKSRELVRLAAQRYSLYLELHHPDEYRALGASSDRRLPFDDARRILESTMPSYITNRLGTRERPLMYILRHTQLLPRHFIQFLNSIWRENEVLGGSPTEVSEQAIVDGIDEVEEYLVADILSGYSASHPLASEICDRLIPHLGMFMTVDQLKQVIKNTKTHQLVPDKVEGVLQLLVDVGALGLHQRSTDLYHEAKFSFTERKIPVLISGQSACLHPAFAKHYQCREVSTNTFDGCLPVYSFGTGLEPEGNT